MGHLRRLNLIVVIEPAIVVGPLGDHTHTLVVVQSALKQELQGKRFPPESIGGVSSSTWLCSLYPMGFPPGS